MSGDFPAFVPFHPKDQRTLSFCVRGIRARVRPPPSRVVLISGLLGRAVMREVSRLGVEWLDEARALAEAGLRERPAVCAGGVDRSGWIVQQILKWEARRHVRGEFYLVVDADTVFLRPTRLVEGGRGVLFERPGAYAPYLATYARLLGRPAANDRSFINHFMVFHRPTLDALVEAIGARAGGTWVEAVLAALDPAEGSSFSEFETYGHFATEQFPERVALRPSDNRGARPWLRSIRLQLALARLLGAGSLSFHTYLADRTLRGEIESLWARARR